MEKKVKGPRGDVGLTGIKHLWARDGVGMSLKQYARQNAYHDNANMAGLCRKWLVRKGCRW